MSRSCSDIDLPEDAFTDDISARLDNRKLHVRIARRDPEGPAMQVRVQLRLQNML